MDSMRYCEFGHFMYRIDFSFEDKPWAILTREECFRIVHVTSQINQNAYLPVLLVFP